MARTLTSLPTADGYRMPAEWEHHAGTWLLWPERPDNWRLGGKPAQRAFTDVASAIARFEPVTVGVNAAQYANARHQLPDTVRVVEISNDDAWVRDCGPTFVVNDAGDVRGVDWAFNAWGGLVDGLYFPWALDDAVAQKICEIEGKDRYRFSDFVLEGGSIHTDGEGTLLTTEECLLSEGRNPQLSKEEIEGMLANTLGIEKVIWLKRGIYLDETNGHVDNICCFVRPGVVLLAWTDDTSDPQYEISKECFDILSAAKDAQGRSFEIHKLHVPDPILISEDESAGVDPVEGSLPRNPGDRLAASYVNFYLCNDAVILPQFGDEHDDAAVKQVGELFPDRTIVPLPGAREILLGGGNIHCITQQQPSGK